MNMQSAKHYRCRCFMITSANNEKVKNVAKLLTNAKARRMQQAFVVEGERIVREIPKERILECYVSADYEADPGVSAQIVEDNIFRKMSDTKNPQGILCVVKMETVEFNEYLSAHKTGKLHILVLEGIQDPGNMGTMIRTAEGAGFDCVLADRNTVDIYNPKVTRATMGSLFRMPVIYTDDLPASMTALREAGVVSYAAHLQGTNDFDKEQYSDRTAILIGNEGNGLSDEIAGMADKLVKIPMQGQLESLNAAVAAALLMYRAR